ncbi:MAG: CvpA family protein [Oscillospiraceae bacterium]|nr:CvpA family protein [Oscillospiraceae bacterium]
MRTILSLVFLIILVYCGWSGYKKGLIMGIFSIIAFVISVYGANLLAVTYSGEVVDALRPFASGFVEVNVVDKTVRPAMGLDAVNLSTADFFAQNPGREKEFCVLTYRSMGIFDATSEQMADEAVAYARDNGADILDAVVEVLCMRISFVGAFLLAFLMVLILLTVIGNIPNISFKIPNLDAVNDIGGAILGVAQGVCLLLVVGWALKFTGLLIPQETIENTFLVPWFMDQSVLVDYLGI